MIKSNTAPTTHEACPLCGQLAAVQPLPENPFMLFYTCPGCGFHDRWLTPTPADIPITTLLSYLQTTEAGSLHAAILAELDRRSREDGLRAGNDNFAPDWAADLCHLQGQLALLVAYLEVNQDLS